MLLGPVHVTQVESHDLQVLVFESPNFPAEQAATHLVPSKNVPDLQLEHSVDNPPVQVKQAASQTLHVLVFSSLYFPFEQVITQVVFSKNLGPEHVKQLSVELLLHVVHVS